MVRLKYWMIRAVILATSLVAMTACAVYEPGPPAYGYYGGPGYYYGPHAYYYGGYGGGWHDRWH